MSNSQNLNINNFNGPLDLLLELVRDKQMDIFDINLAELATDYVRIIEQIKEDDLDLASEYLVMAATLIQLKAKMLLERPDLQDEVDAEKKDLLDQLVKYQQFKNIATQLREKESKRENIHIKDSEDYSQYQLPVDETKLDGKSDAVKLILAMRKMFERTNAKQLRETTIEKFNLSPAERRLEIIKIFKEKENPTFNDIFSVPTINHFVVTVLTVLDMARKQEIKLHQDNQFGDIIIKKGIINE